MGRPPVSKTEPTEQCTVRLTPSQREKLVKLGGAAWVRAQIDSADAILIIGMIEKDGAKPA